jgi:arginine decarboxylase
MTTDWTIEAAEDTYQISSWGEGYFGVNAEGHLVVQPDGIKNGVEISILEVIEEIKSHNLELPVVIRFHDILRSRVQNLNNIFQETIDRLGYKGQYRGVYPIKVNQMREVVEEIVDAGQPFSFGLEAGSKAELMSVLAYNTNPDSLTILNGYKDEDYMRLVMLGRKLN